LREIYFLRKFDYIFNGKMETQCCERFIVITSPKKCSP
jgi:hypothetical protein